MPLMSLNAMPVKPTAKLAVVSGLRTLKNPMTGNASETTLVKELTAMHLKPTAHNAVELGVSKLKPMAKPKEIALELLTTRNLPRQTKGPKLKPQKPLKSQAYKRPTRLLSAE